MTQDDQLQTPNPPINPDTLAEASHEPSSASGLTSPAPVASASGAKSENLERVIDVPLAVHLRFGQRRLSLREVLALGTGSLVELDRQVEEPVDLVLGDRLIARGEVVIVDGNYGLRVTEVMEGAAKRIERQQGLTPRSPVAAGESRP